METTSERAYRQGATVGAITGSLSTSAVLATVGGWGLLGYFLIGVAVSVVTTVLVAQKTVKQFKP